MIRLLDFEEYALKKLPKNDSDFYSCGACGELTLKENEAAFQRLKLLPRVLRDVSKLTTETSILGEKVSMPIGIAPTSCQKIAHEHGEVAMAKAAQSMNTCMVLSTYSTCSIEEVSHAAPDCLRWFQLYVVSDKNITRNLVLRAKAAGYKALVVTVDTQIAGIRYASVRNRFEFPHRFSLPNVETLKVKSYMNSPNTTAMTWKDIDWIRSLTDMPVVLKGIMTVEDAREAVKHGASAIWVSNHGGRQLDTVPAAIEVLPEIVSAVGNEVEIYVDGGVRFGTDVLKAIALGAQAVFIGRPALWGLTYNGEDGARQVLQLLLEEFKIAMSLSGCATVSDITPSLVAHQFRVLSKL